MPEAHSACQFLESLATRGDREAIFWQGQTITYSALHKRIVERAGALTPHAVAGISGSDFLEGLISILAAAKARAVAAPLFTPEAEERFAAIGAGVRIKDGVVSSVANAQPVHPLMESLRQRQHAGLILHSSGTTGQPKAMLHDLDTLLAAYPVRERPPYRILAFMLPDHIGGLDILLRALSSGASVVLPHSRSPHDIALQIQLHRVEILPATPTFLNLLLLSGAIGQFDFSSLKTITFGAESMPQPLLERLRQALPGVGFLQRFGTTETGAFAVSADDASLYFRITDPQVEHRVVEGELWLRTPHRILGYLSGDTGALAADGWYRTGDLVEQRPDGALRIISRKSALINIGGEKVIPGEVEAVLLELPGIAACRVIGESSPITGQMLVAEVAPAPGVDFRLLRSEIRQHCRKRLAPHKVPAKIVAVEAMNLGLFKTSRRQ